MLKSTKKNLTNSASRHDTEPLRLVRGRSSEGKVRTLQNTPVTTKATSSQISNSFEYHVISQNNSSTYYDNYLPLARMPKREEIEHVRRQTVGRKVAQNANNGNGYSQIHNARTKSSAMKASATKKNI